MNDMNAISNQYVRAFEAGAQAALDHIVDSWPELAGDDESVVDDTRKHIARVVALLRHYPENGA
jgi:hypothetical protein